MASVLWTSKHPHATSAYYTDAASGPEHDILMSMFTQSLYSTCSSVIFLDSLGLEASEQGEDGENKQEKVEEEEGQRGAWWVVW